MKKQSDNPIALDYKVLVLEKDLSNEFLQEAAKRGLISRYDVRPEEIFDKMDPHLEHCFRGFMGLLNKMGEGMRLSKREITQMNAWGDYLINQGHWDHYHALIDQTPVKPHLLRQGLRREDGLVILSEHLEESDALDYQAMVDDLLTEIDDRLAKQRDC